MRGTKSSPSAHGQRCARRDGNWVGAVRTLQFALAAAVLGVVVLAAWRLTDVLPAPVIAGIPIGDLARGQPHPSIGLGGPFPAWAPLPDKGLVTGAEIAAPRAPWGASAVAMVKIDDDVDHFMAGYGPRLAASGFRVRRLTTPIGLLIDRPEAQFQADDRQGGHVVYITFLGDARARYVQLTYW